MSENISEILVESWKRVHNNGMNVDPNFVVAKLDSMYNKGDRFYHNLNHIAHGYTELDKVRDLIERKDEMNIAWYFHDSIYDTKKSGNEEKCGELEVEMLRDSGAPEEIGERGNGLILVTKHNVVPEDGDQRIFVDVDLAILGQPVFVFDEYEVNIRKEYSWVSDEDFNKGRGDILKGFLGRDFIYLTEYFRDMYEKNARVNLERSIEKLGA